MPTSFNHIKPGDPLPTGADYINASFDVINAHRAGRTQRPQSTPQRYGEILIHNASGADREQFDLLKISDDMPFATEYDDTDADAVDSNNPIVFEGLAVVTASPWPTRVAVLQEPIKSNSIGRAIIDGITQARVYFDIDYRSPVALGEDQGGLQDPQFLVPKGPTGFQRSYAGGAQLLSRETPGTVNSTRIAYVRLGPVIEPIQLLQSEADIDDGSSVAGRFYLDDEGSYLTLLVDGIAGIEDFNIKAETQLWGKALAGYTDRFLVLGAHWLPHPPSTNGKYKMEVASGYPQWTSSPGA